MNVNMFEHPAVTENVALLRARGVEFVDPGSGYLACGWLGKGRLAEVPDIVAAAVAVLAAPAGIERVDVRSAEEMARAVADHAAAASVVVMAAAVSDYRPAAAAP